MGVMKRLLEARWQKKENQAGSYRYNFGHGPPPTPKAKEPKPEEKLPQEKEKADEAR